MASKLGTPRAHATDQGFTLIEVMIAVTLLSFLSIGIYQATTRSFLVNATLGREATEYSGVLLTLQAVESDLSQIYNPALDPTEAPAANPNAAQTPDFWSVPVRTDGTRRARLQGTREKLTFINNANRRVEADQAQSDFQKVTWEIERNSSGAYSLYRATDWNAFNYDRVSGKPNRVALIENLSSASFSYYRRENKTWEDSWDTESPYVKAEGRWPDLIRLKIEVPDPLNNANQLPLELVVRPNLPLNGVLKNDQELLDRGNA